VRHGRQLLLSSLGARESGWDVGDLLWEGLLSTCGQVFLLDLLKPHN
jgi:hypothetical protein